MWWWMRSFSGSGSASPYRKWFRIHVGALKKHMSYNRVSMVFCSFIIYEEMHLFSQIEDYEEEPILQPGCKEYFWLLCKLIDNIHVKDASQVGTVIWHLVFFFSHDRQIVGSIQNLGTETVPGIILTHA